MTDKPGGPINLDEARKRRRRGGTAAPAPDTTSAPPDDDGATWPGGFEMEREGLFRRDPRNDEKPREWVCDPFRVLAETRPELGDAWGLLLAWQDADGREHRLILPRALLHTDERAVFGRLAERGVRVAGSRSARSALVECLARVRSTKKARTVSRIGWSLPPNGGAAFVLPDRVCGAAVDGEELFLDLHPPPATFRAHGSLAGWQREVAARCAGNTRLLLTVSAALAGPLLTPLGEEPGGFHLRSSSSIGKTTALQVAASVWGAPSGHDAFVRQWRGTINGAEEMAKGYNDTILPLDEIGQVDPAKVGDIVYMISNGMGASRARDRGGLRTMNTWRLMFLSSGEASLASLMNQAKHTTKAGQEVRFLDIAADAGAGFGLFETLHDGGDGDGFSRSLKAAAQAEHGHAGPAFVTWLAPRVADVAWVDDARTRLREIAGGMTPHAADGQVRRAAGRFALLALAGELATEAGVTGWPLGEATRGVATCFDAWLEERGTVGQLEDRNVIRAVRTFLMQHDGARFERLNEAPAAGDIGGAAAPPDARIIARAGWKWTESEAADGTKLYVYGIEPEVFRKEVIPPGMSDLDAKQKLARAGLLRTETRGGRLRYTMRKSVPGKGRPELVVFPPEILEKGDDEG